MSKTKKLFDHKWWFYDLVKWTSLPFINLFFRHKKIYAGGKKSKNLFKGRVVICSNHVSYEDAMGIISSIWGRRISFIIAKHLMEQHQARHFFKGVGCIPVDRENLDIGTIKQAINVIDRGHAVGIFPEGKINNDNKLLPFKSGAVLLSFLAKADILPVYISKRKSKKERWTMIVGDRINITEMLNDSYPAVDKIDKITNYLNQKELELKSIYENLKGEK